MDFFRDAGAFQLRQVRRIFHYAIFHNSRQSQTDGINRSTVADGAHGLLTHQFEQAIQRRIQQRIRVFVSSGKWNRREQGFSLSTTPVTMRPVKWMPRLFPMIQISSTVLLRRFRPLKAAAL